MDKKIIEERINEIEDAFTLLRHAGLKNHEPSSRLKNAEKLVLFHIGRFEKEGVTPSFIAKKLGVSFSAVTHHINSLQENGLIERVEKTGDHRTILLHLTESGKKEILRFRKQRTKRLGQIIEHLGEKDSLILVTLVKKITNYLNNNKEGVSC